jgi:glucan phosphoethanolaminetransferase (alkaline phosphatase superfamily)
MKEKAISMLGVLIDFVWTVCCLLLMLYVFVPVFENESIMLMLVTPLLVFSVLMVMFFGRFFIREMTKQFREYFSGEKT